MSWRIEHADALSLVRELPDNWAQTCITSPPSTQASEITLAVLAEVHRVLREDGTLWLLRHPGEPLLDALRKQGWILQRPPVWARPLVLGCNAPLRPSLLTRQARYFYNAHAAVPHARPQGHSRPSTSRRARHVQRCGLARGQDPRLVWRCVLAGSSPVACGACGAPYRRARPGESTSGVRRPTCPHNNPEGRCLVLDPFYKPGAPAAEAAHRNGRSFLGIACHTGTGAGR
jgi:hypothetical protein